MRNDSACRNRECNVSDLFCKTVSLSEVTVPHASFVSNRYAGSPTVERTEPVWNHSLALDDDTGSAEQSSLGTDGVVQICLGTGCVTFQYCERSSTGRRLARILMLSISTAKENAMAK